MDDIICSLQCLKTSDGTQIETVQTVDIKGGLLAALQYAEPQICAQGLKFSATAAMLCVMIFNTQDIDIFGTLKCHGALLTLEMLSNMGKANMWLMRMLLLGNWEIWRLMK